MITDALLGWLTGAVAALLNVLPSWSAPSWFADLGSQATTVGSYMAGFSYWLPWHELTTVVEAVVGLFLLVSSVRAALWLWSLVPVIGSGK